MNAFAVRRRLMWCAAVLVSIATAFWLRRQQLALGHPYSFSGWLLILLVLFLTAFNLRKKLTVLPLGSARTWTQLHIYAGLLAGFVFLLHTQFQLPRGPFNWLLYCGFSGTFLSGVIGLVLTRRIPPRLARDGGAAVYERIPILRRDIRHQAHALVVQSVQATQSTTIADYFQRNLADYFDAPADRWTHLRDPSRVSYRQQQEFETIEPYLSDHERDVLTELRGLVASKRSLDHQLAGLDLLRYWLFLHIPLTYGTIVCAFFHIVFVYAFSGGIR